ncbi:MAG TPA: ankyrin repeat domain-containing protein [Patescibacteria group bacterium]|nr:ankyrin repeat domain-containing protein [Patescibacteria group bacterium]
MPTAKAIDAALEKRDIPALLKMLEQGMDANRAGKDGNALLHHAAQFGDAELAEALLARGAKTFAHNKAQETPWDIAVAFGHDALAARLQTALQDEMKQAAASGKIPYASLQEIRDAGAKQGHSEFFALAHRGQFTQVVALAEKDGGFTAADLLERGSDGRSVILRLAQLDQLALLLKPALWAARINDFQNVWTNLPKNYRDGHYHEALLASLRQAKLQSYAKPKLPGLGRPPKL